MRSEPTPTTDAPTDDPLPGAIRWLERGAIREWTAASVDAEFHIRHLVAEIERLRGAAPSAPTTDAPADDLSDDVLTDAEWRAHAIMAGRAHPLLFRREVHRILDHARGGATTWPALDFGACRSLYTDLHEAMAQYGDPDDANRVRDFNSALREHLPVLRGGATAPTPDPTTQLAEARETIKRLNRRAQDAEAKMAKPRAVALEEALEALRQLRVGGGLSGAAFARADNAVRRLIGRDTGASHE